MIKQAPLDIYSDGNAAEYCRINNIDPADFELLMYDPEAEQVEVPDYFVETGDDS